MKVLLRPHICSFWNEKSGFGYSTYCPLFKFGPPWPNPDFSSQNGICTASLRTFMNNPG